MFSRSLLRIFCRLCAECTPRIPGFAFRISCAIIAEELTEEEHMEVLKEEIELDAASAWSSIVTFFAPPPPIVSSPPPQEAENRPNIPLPGKFQRKILRGLRNISDTP